ncbi:MAG: carboxypeptidase-like regulatory domain-containing protein [Hyphomicrobiales bacterium]
MVCFCIYSHFAPGEPVLLEYRAAKVRETEINVEQNNIELKKYILFAITIFKAVTLLSQDDQTFRIQGRVKSLKDNNPISFTHIITSKTKKGTISDSRGFFSLALPLPDSVLFSSIGYKNYVFYVGDSLLKTEPKSLMIYLIPDTTILQEVTVYPHDSYDEFKRKLINNSVPPPMPMHPSIQIWINNATDNLSEFSSDGMGGISNFIYNTFFNSNAILERKLLRNRRRINKINKKLGLELIPELPEHLSSPKTFKNDYDRIIYDQQEAKKKNLFQ